MSSPGSETLFAAINQGDLPGVQAAVTAGADVNEARTDLYPLLLAVREKHRAIAEYLIEEDAAIDAPNNFGWTALLEATRSGQMDMVQLMDEYEIDMTVVTQRGDGLIHAAVQGDTSGMVSYFQARGVNIDLPNRHGVTPVMLAIEKRHEASFRELVTLGANLDLKDTAGGTARDRLVEWAEGQAIVAAQAPVAQDAPVVAEADPSVPAMTNKGLSQIRKRVVATR